MAHSYFPCYALLLRFTQNAICMSLNICLMNVLCRCVTVSSVNVTQSRRTWEGSLNKELCEPDWFVGGMSVSN